MPYYLVPMVPNASPGPFGRIGTHPLSLDYGGNAVILDATVAYGWTPDPIPDPRATWICNDKQDLVTGAARAALQQLVPGRVMGARFYNIVGDMLKTPPPGKWKPLTPHLGRKQLEILLGPGNFLGSGNGNPGLLWSEPADVHGPHSQNLTDTFNRADGALDGSTSSDGLFAWTGKADFAACTVVSNQATTVRAGVDKFPLYIGSVPMDTADAWVQLDQTQSGTGTYCGPLVRNTDGTGTGTGTDTGYFFILNRFASTFELYGINLVGPDTLIAFIASSGATSGSLYLQFSGSTYYTQRNGVTLLSGTNLVSDGSAGHRKVGFLTAAATDDTSLVTINNFFAADISVDTRVTPAAGAIGLTGYSPGAPQSNPGPATFIPSTGRLNLSDKNPILTPLPGALVATGQAPLIATLSVVLIPDTGALAITGAAPIIKQQGVITPPSGALTIAGQPANVSRSLAPATGTIALTGYTPQVLQILRVEITPSTGHLTLSLGTTLRPDAGVLTITGVNPSLGVIRPGTGALTLTGITPIVSAGGGSVIKTPDAGALWFGEEFLDLPPTGSLSLAGGIPILVINAIRTPDSGALVVDGRLPILPVPALIPGTGALTIVGQPAATSRSLAPGTATLTFTGVPPAVGGFVQAIPVPGALVLQGYPPQLFAGGMVTLTPGAGALTTAAQPPAVQRGVVRIPDSGALVLASDPSDIAGLRIAPDAAELALAGYAPRMFVETKFRPGTGALVLAGHAPNLGALPPQGGRRFYVPPPRRFRFQTPQREEK